MLHQLTPERYEIARPVFAVMADHLAVESILQGRTPAPVYVDNLKQPTTALTWTQQRVYLVGNGTNANFLEEINLLLEKTYIQNALTGGREAMTLYYAPEHWDKRWHRVLAGRHPISAPRRCYTQPEQAAVIGRDSRQPPGVIIKPVDQMLLTQLVSEDRQLLEEEMLSERSSVADFHERSFGYCAITRQGRMIGWCLSEYNTADRCEVGIWTHPDHRRQGIATALGTALLHEAYQLGLSVGWHCYTSNTGSNAAALKIGLQKTLDYNAVFLYFNRVDHAVIYGDVLLDRGLPEEASTWFMRAFELAAFGQARGGRFLNSDPGWCWVCRRAAAAALVRDEFETASRYIARAKRRGWDSSDLEKLHQEVHAITPVTAQLEAFFLDQQIFSGE